MKPIEKSWRYGQAADRTRQRVRARDSIAIVSAEYIANIQGDLGDDSTGRRFVAALET